jgi:hypothetical protein
VCMKGGSERADGAFDGEVGGGSEVAACLKEKGNVRMGGEVTNCDEGTGARVEGRRAEGAWTYVF